MSFITESRLAYKKVQEAEDHEISMARGELEAIADKATQLSSMLQGKSDEGNPLEAWVQSKITKAKDYINSVSDYMMYNPKINESYKLEETTFEKIYQMQQDGKTAEDIAKELKLKPDLVKKVLGEEVNFTSQEKEIIKNILENKKEIPKQSDLSTYDSIIKKFINFKKSKSTNEQVELKEFSDAQIAQLKKEYGPLKGKTITTSQYQQLKNILFKLQDGDLEKLQKQNIPFASTGAGSILRIRKSPVKITSVKVPGLEGMAEESFKDNIIKKLVKPAQDYNKKAAEIKTIDMTDGSAHVRFPKNDTKAMAFYKSKGYKVTTKYEEVEITETHFAIGQQVIYHGPKNPITPIKAKIIGMVSPQKGAYYFIKKADGENTYAAPEQMKLDEAMFDIRLDVDGSVSEREAQTVSKMLSGKGIQAKVEPSEKDKTAVTINTSKSKEEVVKALGNIVDESKRIVNEACWTGYKQVGLKKKGKRMVPNCVPEERRLYIESIVAVKNKAEKSGMPYSVLKQVYDRGMAAWKGGHRPGATQVQWALARVNSFITKSSGTWGGADSDLAKKVKG